MKLLIADDNPHIRYLLGEIVGNDFDEIFECENGFEAIYSFEKNKPDWVLMDLEMPLMDGLTATQSIIEKYPKAKIIILSEDIDKKSRHFAKKIGANACAMKDNLLQVRSMMGV